METIRIVGFHEEPYVSECFEQYPSRTCPYPGVVVTYLHTILTSAEFKIQWIKADSYEEAIDMLMNNTADMPAWSDTLEIPIKSHTNIIALPIASGLPITLTYRKRERKKVTHVLYDALAPSTWSVLASSLLIWFVTVYWLKKAIQSRLQGQNLQFHGLNIGWTLFFALILYVYENLLTLQFYNSNVEIVHPFTDLRDLAVKVHRNECHLVFRPSIRRAFSTFFGKTIIENRTEDSAEVQEFLDLINIGLKLNPPTELDENFGAEQIIAEMERLQKIYKWPLLVGYDVHGAILRVTSPGNFITRSVDQFKSPPLAYFYRSKSYVAQHRITTALAGGQGFEFHERLLSQYYTANRKVIDSGAEETVSNSQIYGLKIEQVFDVFALLVGGLLLSGLIVCIELFACYSGILQKANSIAPALSELNMRKDINFSSFDEVILQNADSSKDSYRQACSLVPGLPWSNPPTPRRNNSLQPDNIQFTGVFRRKTFPNEGNNYDE